VNESPTIWHSLSFAWPVGLLLLVPMFGLLGWQLWGKGAGGPVALTGLEYLRDKAELSSGRKKWARAALWAVLALGVALLWAGPVLHSTRPLFSANAQASHKNILMLMDISRSMSVPMGAEKNVYLPGQARTGATAIPEDAKPRFVAAREALMAFVERFKGERLGLILFSTEPFLARWPTVETDTRFLEVLHENIGRGEVSQLQGFSSLTNIDKALGLAREVIARQKGVRGGAVVMISDAEDDLENMSVAAHNLRDDGIRLYTIGVGISDEVAQHLSERFPEDPGFRIFRADSPNEIQEAYRVVAELEESPLSPSDQRDFETDLRWLLSLVLVVIAGLVVFFLEGKFHEAQTGNAGR